MFPSIVLRSYLMYAYIFIITWIPSVRLQCSSGTILRTACHGLSSITSHLANDPESMVTITCPNPGQNGQSHTGWSLSPGGGDSGLPLDTSSSKYTLTSSNSLEISNINGTDEGLYRCVYGDSGSVRHACIYVYGRAVFASCPLGTSASCDSDPTPLSVVDGGSVSFNATVIHTPGGSCDFRQEITGVRLTRVNPEFDVDDQLLLSCNMRLNEPCMPLIIRDSRVSLNRGNDPGIGFVFTLTGANINDSKEYKVEVEVKHPSTNSQNTITKLFRLNVSRPVITINTPDTTTASGTSVATDHSTPVVTSSTEASLSNKQPDLSIVITTAVIAAMVIAAVVVALVIGIHCMTIKINKRKRRPSEKVQSEVRTVECSGPQVEEKIGDTILQIQTHLNGTIVSASVQNQPEVNINAVTELPPPNNRTSYIEPDSGAFSHWDDVDSQVASNV